MERSAWVVAFGHALRETTAGLSRDLAEELGLYFHSRADGAAPNTAVARFLRLMEQAGIDVNEVYDILRSNWEIENSDCGFDVPVQMPRYGR